MKKNKTHIKKTAVRLVNYKVYLKEKLKDPKFRRLYEIDRVKVSLAHKFAELRQEKHLSQKEFARRLGVSQQFISQLETGYSRNLTIDTIVRVASALGHTVQISFSKKTGRSASLEVV